MQVKKYKYLKLNDRKWIEYLLSKGMSVPDIAREMELPKATVYNEIKRGMDSKQGKYHAALGQAVFDYGIKHRGRRVAAPAGAAGEERMA